MECQLMQKKKFLFKPTQPTLSTLSMLMRVGSVVSVSEKTKLFFTI